MTVVGFVVLEKLADGLLVDHMGRPFTRDEAVDVGAQCGAQCGGEWLLARVVIEEES